MPTLGEEWERAARAWVRWARDPDLDDDYWGWHRDAFLALLPAPRGVTVDIGCGEGRLTRSLAGSGHRIIGFDRSATVVHAAATHPEASLAAVADGAALPLPDATAALVVLFMCIHDMDEPAAVLAEAARVLDRDGRIALALLSPEVTGRLAGDVEEGRYELRVGHGVERMSYRGAHRSLRTYLAAISRAGLTVVDRRVPVRADGATPFLHLLLARAPSGP